MPPRCASKWSRAPAGGEAPCCCILRACCTARPTPPPDAAFWGSPTSLRAAQHAAAGREPLLHTGKGALLATHACFHGPRCTTPRRRRPPVPRCGSGGGRSKVQSGGRHHSVVRARLPRTSCVDLTVMCQLYTTSKVHIRRVDAVRSTLT